MVSIQTVIGPAPLGMDLSADRTKTNNAVVISLCVLSVIAVVIRFYVRLKGGKPDARTLHLDDCLVAFALVS